jgi:transposase-like protein
MRYSKELKLEAVGSYLRGDLGGYKRTSDAYGLVDKKTLRNWVKLYREYGEVGFEVKLRKILHRKPSEEDEKSEILRLRAENAYLRKLTEEREVKKKKIY